MSRVGFSDRPLDVDHEAMRRLAEGDDLALNGIMQRWKEKVAAFLYRQTGSVEVAADLTQETFVRLYQSRTRYEPTADFSTYLFRIAVNLGRNHSRWRERHPTVSIEECHMASEQMRGFAASPDQEAQMHENTRRIERAMANLPVDWRAALHLSIYEEMSHQEIAHTLDCSIKAVETRIYRARLRLKHQLADLRPR